MSRLEREAWSVGIKLFGALLVLAVAWWVVAWPWMLATKQAVKNGHPKGSSDYNSAGWNAELIYLAVLAVVVPLIVWGAIHRQHSQARKRLATPQWRYAPNDPAGLQRWWDGNFWTGATQWDFNAVRPDGAAFTHGSCTIGHRTAGAAARCTSRM